MKKKQKIVVFFNASVVIAGLISSSGGSAKLLRWAKNRKIKGIASEIILQEVIRHKDKIGIDEDKVRKQIDTIFSQIIPPPDKSLVEKFYSVVIDHGDAHVLASCIESKSNFLVTLDQKHLLSLQKKIKKIKIVTPGQLIAVSDLDK